YYERDAAGQPRHDPRLFSYDPAFAATPSSRAQPRFLDVHAATPLIAAGEVPLDGLRRFWRDPTMATLLRGHGISLQALDDTGWPDREPLETGLARIERIDRQLLFEALAAGTHTFPAQPPAWLARSGVLAGGAIGERSWDGLRLTGTVERVFRGATGAPLLFDAQAARMAGLKDLLDYYIDWAALQLSQPGVVQ